MDRTKKTIKLPVCGKDVVMFDYLTGGDKRKIVKETDTDKQLTIMLDSIVVSVDGKSENIGTIVDGLHGKDFDAIFTEVTHIMKASSLDPEKKS